MVVAERDEREEELLDPETPLPLVGVAGLAVIVVPLRVLESSPLVGAATLPVVPPAGLVPTTVEGRADEPVLTRLSPRNEVAPLPTAELSPLVPRLEPTAICVPPREPPRRLLPPKRSLYEGREVLPPAEIP